MPVFAYEFNENDPNNPIRIEYVGNDDPVSIEHLRMFLMTDVLFNPDENEDTELTEEEEIDEVYALGSSPEELIRKTKNIVSVLRAINEAPLDDLPVEIVHPIIVGCVMEKAREEDREVKAIDKETGVLINFSRKGKKNDYSGALLDIEKIWEMKIKGEPIQQELIERAVLDGFTYYAFTPEQLGKKDGKEEYRFHITLGTKDEDGYFIPGVTVLSKSYNEATQAASNEEVEARKNS